MVESKINSRALDLIIKNVANQALNSHKIKRSDFKTLAAKRISSLKFFQLQSFTFNQVVRRSNRRWLTK